MTKYRGTIDATTAISVNVAEGTPFRQMIMGEMLAVACKTLTASATGVAPLVNASLQIGRTVLFSGPINQVGISGTDQWGPQGLMAADRMYMGPLPVGGTISLTFVATSAATVIWEIGGEVIS